MMKMMIMKKTKRNAALEKFNFNSFEAPRWGNPNEKHEVMVALPSSTNRGFHERTVPL